MVLSRLASEFAAEIRLHDWSDAPYRMDRAGHQLSDDGPNRLSGRSPLTADETDAVRMNVIWVTAQVLKHADLGLDLYEFAAAAGAPNRMLYNRDGKPSGGIPAGLRWQYGPDGQPLGAATPGHR